MLFQTADSDSNHKNKKEFLTLREPRREKNPLNIIF